MPEFVTSQFSLVAIGLAVVAIAVVLLLIWVLSIDRRTRSVADSLEVERRKVAEMQMVIGRRNAAARSQGSAQARPQGQGVPPQDRQCRQGQGVSASGQAARQPQGRPVRSAEQGGAVQRAPHQTAQVQVGQGQPRADTSRAAAPQAASARSSQSGERMRGASRDGRRVEASQSGVVSRRDAVSRQVRPEVRAQTARSSQSSGRVAAQQPAARGVQRTEARDARQQVARGDQGASRQAARESGRTAPAARESNRPAQSSSRGKHAR